MINLFEKLKNNPIFAIILALFSALAYGLQLVWNNSFHNLSYQKFQNISFFVSVFKYEIIVFIFGFLIFAIIFFLYKNIGIFSYLHTIETNQKDDDHVFVLIYRFLIYLVSIFAVCIVLYGYLPWAKSTYVFFRDNHFGRYNRIYDLLAAYEAKKNNNYDLALSQFNDFKVKYPDRVEPNNINEEISSLENAEKLSNIYTSVADSLEKGKGFGKDILNLRIEAVNLKPNQINIKNLDRTVKEISTYYNRTRSSQKKCQNSEQLSSSDIAKTLVFMGLLRNPENYPKLRQSDQLCFILQNNLNYFILLEYWDLVSLEKYLTDIDTFNNSTEISDRFTNLYEIDYNVERIFPTFNVQISDADADGDSYYSETKYEYDYEKSDLFSFYPIWFKVYTSQSEALTKSTKAPKIEIPRVAIYFYSGSGMSFCWHNASGLENIYISGWISKATISKSNICNLKDLSVLPVLKPHDEGVKTEEIEFDLVKGLTNSLKRINEGNKLSSSIPSETIRRTLCYAILDITKNTINKYEEEDKNWMEYCQIEYINYSQLSL